MGGAFDSAAFDSAAFDAAAYVDVAVSIERPMPVLSLYAEARLPGVYHEFRYQGEDPTDPARQTQVLPKRDWLTAHVIDDNSIPRSAIIGGVGGGSLNWRGPWSSATAYSVDDIVGYGGSSYVCTADCTDVPPPNVACWQTLAQRGATWWSGSGVPSLVVGSSPGDYYLDEDSGLVYVLE